MAYYIIISVKINKNKSPFLPLSYLDLGHADVTLWKPPESPETFSLHVDSVKNIVYAAFIPQKAVIRYRKTFTRIPAFWKEWEISEKQYRKIKQYLEDLTVECNNGFIRYDVRHFNCLHLAYYCLKVADLDTPPLSTRKILWLPIVTPHLFIKTIMPNARFSIMYHDLACQCDFNEKVRRTI